MSGRWTSGKANERKELLYAANDQSVQLGAWRVERVVERRVTNVSLTVSRLKLYTHAYSTTPHTHMRTNLSYRRHKLVHEKFTHRTRKCTSVHGRTEEQTDRLLEDNATAGSALDKEFGRRGMRWAALKRWKLIYKVCQLQERAERMPSGIRNGLGMRKNNLLN